MFIRMVYLQHSLVVTWLVPRETAAVTENILCMYITYPAEAMLK